MKKIILIITLLFGVLGFSQATISGNFSICLPGPNTTQLIGSGTPHTTTPWLSTNLGIATVDNTGLVTAVGFGATTITYRDSSNNTVSQNVYVSTFPTLGSNNGAYYTCVGITKVLWGSEFAHPISAWSSSNESIATVEDHGENGFVTGVSVGVTNITYTNIVGCSVQQSFVVRPFIEIVVVTDEITDSSISFHWNVIPNAVAYRIIYWINMSPVENPPQSQIIETTELSHTINGLQLNDSIYLTVAPITGISDICSTGGGGVYQISSLSAQQNLISSELKLYPIPVFDKLFLSSNTNKNIKIYDIIGNKVIDENVTDILNTNNLSSGVYLCEITEGDLKTVKRIVKN